MTEVIIHRLAGRKKAFEACRLVERLYRDGKLVAIWVEDGARATALDDYLWTYAQNSFVPHSLADAVGGGDDPVVIVTGALANPNRSSVLVIADRLATLEAAAAWAEVHDLASGAEDEGKRAAWEAAGYGVREQPSGEGSTQG